MHESPTRISRLKISVVVLILSALIASCGTAPQKPDSADTDDTKIPITLEAITERLDAANKMDNAGRTRIYLNITHALLEAEEIDWARNTLAQLSPLSVPSDQYIRYAVLSSALAIAQGKPFRAKAFLWQDRVNQVALAAPIEEKIKLHEMRARLLHSLAEYRASIEERLVIDGLIEEGTQARESNNEQLWQTLMELPYSELKLESQIQNNRLAKGWYTLAALSKDNQTNLEQQISAVENWVMRWPEHPASLSLPADLRLLKKLDAEKPENIAVLLPFTGRFSAAANAILDGIMAAYYDDTASGRAPELRVYDSSTEDINALYDEALLSGAQLVIGPLEQEKITALATRPELQVPTLALNRIDIEGEAPRGLFQFSLALEDEAEQVASQAWREGYRRAMMLAPQTSSGDRSIESFQDRWLELGGELTKDYRFAGQQEYSNTIKSALKIDESEQRRNDVVRLIGQRVEFEPRRRKDVDFIFLYSHASQARQIKPILAFHYAGDLPVYSVRNVYSGVTDSKKDRDLDDIRFTTLPWFFDDELPEKKVILENVGDNNFQFFYALGVDAYHIHPRLRQLKEIKQANYYGVTGTLHLDEQQRLRREQIWAKFVDGKPTPMMSFSEDDTTYQ